MFDALTDRNALPIALGAVRYLGVLTVWLALLAIRPRLAIDIFRHRRPDSPIPRLRPSAALG